MIIRVAGDRSAANRHELAINRWPVQTIRLDCPARQPGPVGPAGRKTAPVAQLDRASVFGTEGWGFESLRVYLAQACR